MKLKKLPVDSEMLPSFIAPVGIMGGNTRPGPGHVIATKPLITIPSDTVNISAAITG